jgi:hypothetical protein
MAMPGTPVFLSRDLARVSISAIAAFTFSGVTLDVEDTAVPPDACPLGAVGAETARSEAQPAMDTATSTTAPIARMAERTCLVAVTVCFIVSGPLRGR